MGIAHDRAIFLVRHGRTFAEAAEESGGSLSRSAVAASCRRAGVKAPWTDLKRERHGDKISEKLRQRWANDDARKQLLAGQMRGNKRAAGPRRPIDPAVEMASALLAQARAAERRCQGFRHAR